MCGLGPAPVQLVLPSALPEALQRYLVLIYPGLVGAVTMVSCSILALTHLLFEFKGKCCFLKAWETCPQSRRMPRRSREGGRKAGTKPSRLPSLLPSAALPAPRSPLPVAASHPILRVGRRRWVSCPLLALVFPLTSKFMILLEPDSYL